MTEKKLLYIFKKTAALLEGHFLLTSGLHSSKYIEKFRIFEYPRYTEKICKEIAKLYKDKNITVVCGPMTGGIILAHEIAKALGVKMVFTERTNGVMTLKRGFHLSATDRVVIVEDIVTTGSSINEVIDVVKESGCKIIGISAIADRSSGQASFPYPFQSLIKFNIKNYLPEDCPLCKSGIPLIKPGSTNK